MKALSTLVALMLFVIAGCSQAPADRPAEVHFFYGEHEVVAGIAEDLSFEGAIRERGEAVGFFGTVRAEGDSEAYLVDIVVAREAEAGEIRQRINTVFLAQVDKAVVIGQVDDVSFRLMLHK
ncbi:MAG: hypothetical protein MI794_13695 [Pseudomonadales bacterium]|nr:hypothetical protein [Pseudomonadales bacterium]